MRCIRAQPAHPHNRHCLGWAKEQSLLKIQMQGSAPSQAPSQGTAQQWDRQCQPWALQGVRDPSYRTRGHGGAESALGIGGAVSWEQRQVMGMPPGTGNRARRGWSVQEHQGQDEDGVSRSRTGMRCPRAAVTGHGGYGMPRGAGQWLRAGTRCTEHGPAVNEAPRGTAGTRRRAGRSGTGPGDRR